MALAFYNQWWSVSARDSGILSMRLSYHSLAFSKASLLRMPLIIIGTMTSVSICKYVLSMVNESTVPTTRAPDAECTESCLHPIEHANILARDHLGQQTLRLFTSA